MEFTVSHSYRTNRTTPVRWLISHALRHPTPLLLLLGGALLNAGLAAIPPVLIGQAINAIVAAPPQYDQLILSAVLVAISQVIRGATQLGRNFGAEFIAQRVERDIRDELFSSLLGKSMTFHSLQPVGEVMARATNDVRQINYLFSPGFNLVVGSLVFLVVPLIVAPRYHYSLVLTPAIFIFLYFFSIKSYLKSLRPITDQVRYAFGQLNSRLAEAIDGVETVKGAVQEKKEAELFFQNAGKYRDAAVRQGDVEARFIPLLLFGISVSTGLFHALYLFQTGLIDVGGVVAYFGLLLLLDFPTFISLFAYSEISLGLAGARRVLDLMQKENILDQNKNGHNNPIAGEIEFRNVCFSYQEEGDSSLENLTFTIPAGKTVAIVGQTGSGKTSLVRLVNRTWDITSGQVLVDGVDVRDWNLEDLRKGISMIEQDIFLFSRSVSDNISFGKPGATLEEIETAAKAAQAHEFISGFSEGYETVIGERGVTLSGGQRQRLALARAFLTNPAILILDDSTSAIDSATEDKIQRAIYAAAKGRTTLIITHRLSQIRWADLVIVLRKGQIVAQGTHAELKASSESYRNIFSE